MRAPKTSGTRWGAGARMAWPSPSGRWAGVATTIVPGGPARAVRGVSVVTSVKQVAAGEPLLAEDCGPEPLVEVGQFVPGAAQSEPERDDRAGAGAAEQIEDLGELH